MGVHSFSQLDGMFAFSIYDKRVNKLFIARDFFGEKPLYYSNVDGQFYLGVGTEICKIAIKLIFQRSLKKGSSCSFSLTYIPAPYTIYDGVSKLEPNNYIEYAIRRKNAINTSNTQKNSKRKLKI